MEALTEIHSHMVRSPPPIEWPPPTPSAGRTPARSAGSGGGLLSPRSNDSSDGLEMDYPSGNYYTRYVHTSTTYERSKYRKIVCILPEIAFYLQCY